MKFERPGESAETFEAKYNRLLTRGMETSKGYNKAAESLSEDEDEDWESEEDGSELRSELRDQMESEIQERVDLLKEQGVTNIEAVFPRVKVGQGVEDNARKLGEITAEMTRMMMASDFDQAKFDQLRDKARELSGQKKSNELSDEELEAFDAARKNLARQEGYEVVDGEDSEPGAWIALRKNGVEFSMKHFAFPSEFGIGGFSRISKIDVYRKAGKTSELLMNYDRTWDVANEDPEVQKDIDRLIAIFG